MKASPKRNRFAWQTLALVIAVLSPVGLYVSLSHHNMVLAAIHFVFLAVSMGLTLWASG